MTSEMITEHRNEIISILKLIKLFILVR